MAGGRPTKRIPETEARILEALRAGNTRRTAAEYGGITVTTFCDWVNRFPEFSEAVKKAEADCVAAMVAVIKRAATGYPVKKTVTKTREVGGVAETETTVTEYIEHSWQAAAWYLERRIPEDFARFVFDPSKLTPEQMAEFLRHQAGGGAPGDNPGAGRG